MSTKVLLFPELQFFNTAFTLLYSGFLVKTRFFIGNLRYCTSFSACFCPFFGLFLFIFAHFRLIFAHFSRIFAFTICYISIIYIILT